MTSPPSPAMSGGLEAPAPLRNPFPFQHKPNTLDRDRIVVPAGWDSWGKISVLREGFDAKSWGEAWERNLEETEGQGTGEAGAKKLFGVLVPDQGERVSSTELWFSLFIDGAIFSSRVCCRQSAIQCQNKHSSLSIMMRIRKRPIETRGLHSGIRLI